MSSSKSKLMHLVSHPLIGATVSTEVIRPYHEAVYATTTKVAFLIQAWTDPRLRLPGFPDSRHVKVARLAPLLSGHIYPPGNTPGSHFCYKLSGTQGHSATGRIMSIKNSNDTIGNQTRDLPACSAVRPPTVPLRAPLYLCRK
jgi:hypothetical protein